MKKKGFTIIELLSVIFILGLVLLITTNVMSKQNTKSIDQLYDAQLKMIEISAKLWGSENFNQLPKFDNEELIITLREIKEAGLIEDVKNPKTKELFSDDLRIKIIKVNKIYKYEIIEHSF